MRVERIGILSDFFMWRQILGAPAYRRRVQSGLLSGVCWPVSRTSKIDCRWEAAQRIETVLEASAFLG